MKSGMKSGIKNYIVNALMPLLGDLSVLILNRTAERPNKYFPFAAAATHRHHSLRSGAIIHRRVRLGFIRSHSVIPAE